MPDGAGAGEKTGGAVMPEAPDVLDVALATFDAHRRELVRDAPGKFVLIYLDRIVGVFDTDDEALAQGYERFGNVPFLVKEIAEADAPVHMMSLLFGTDG